MSVTPGDFTAHEYRFLHDVMLLRNRIDDRGCLLGNGWAHGLIITSVHPEVPACVPVHNRAQA